MCSAHPTLYHLPVADRDLLSNEAVQGIADGLGIAVAQRAASTSVTFHHLAFLRPETSCISGPGGSA